MPGKSAYEISVSIVIPCYNPTDFLRETIDSVLAQTHPPTEVIMVNDGTDKPGARDLLRSLVPRVTRCIDQANLGLPAARNAGFRAATGKYVLPLDADDRIAPSFVAECLAAIQAHPEAAFVYTDYRVFGDTAYVERLGEYNLYNLVGRNAIVYASLIRRADWELVGGYDESLRLGYEDWDFWLRLGERERFGYHLKRALFHYRKSGRSLFTLATEHDQELRESIRASHPRLFSPEGRARIKARWAPAVCVLGSQPGAKPTIEDWQHLPVTDTRVALERSTADAFLVPAPGTAADPHSAEFCALAVWGGKAVARMPDGALCVSRSALASVRSLHELARKVGRSVAPRRAYSPAWPGRLEQLHRHLVNAELASPDNWLRHPVRSVGRLIPLRAKERINRAAGRPVFDLTFYLKFQMQSVLITDTVVPLLRYMPPRPDRRRVALVNPHLGPGGAESVLLELAGAIDRRRHEVFLLATQSQDPRWRTRWEQVTDHIYDLAALVPPDRLVAALCSIAANWEFDMLFIQNSLAAYSAVPHLRRVRPELRIVDIIHAVDPAWDFVGSTAPVAAQIDLRVVISESSRQRLLRTGVPGEKIRLIRNGVDLERFRPAPPRTAEALSTIVFVGRLDPVKRPLLLVDIALALVKLRGGRDFRVIVAGDGPEGESLRIRVRRAGLNSVFALLGHVDDMPKLLAEADVVVVPSQAEGIPLSVLEALATAKPVVCSAVGAVSEVLGPATGILIQPGPDLALRFAAALQRLLDEPGLRDDMGRAGRRKVEAEYDRRQSRQAYRDLFAL
jgi:glycosyltransferase involved in cell wall biosynthesis